VGAESTSRFVTAALTWAVIGTLSAMSAQGQQDPSDSRRTAIIEFPNLGPIPGSTAPALGPGPGALAPSMDPEGIGTAIPGILGGKRRTGILPRGGPSGASASTLAAARGMSVPEVLPVPAALAAAAPPVAIDSSLLRDEGPTDGLTLDAAIERTMLANLDIRALRHELTQADADILTAGLRTNPLVYMDSQFIPYGSFSEARPGGPTQYDLNITYPIDVAGKRRARTVVARMARTVLGEADEAYEDAREGLGVLLNLPLEETTHVEPRGALQSQIPPPPPVDRLVELALRCRPDLRAARLGIDRAGAEIALQRANRVDDVFLFYDPITIQDNSPFGRQSASSWAVGLTFAMPIFNRNQGNIARAESNLAQTRLEMEAIERRVAAEVRLAEREYRRSVAALEELERDVVPRASALTRRKTAEFAAGTIGIDDYQTHLDAAGEVGQSLRDALVRHRRAAFDVNAAVGLRILP